VLEKGGDDDMTGLDKVLSAATNNEDAEISGTIGNKPSTGKGLLNDPRFARLFKDEDFEIDETSHEFQSINPSTQTSARLPKGLTAVEEEELEDRHGSSSDESSSESETEQKQSATKEKPQDNGRISSSSYKRSGHRSQRPQMIVSSSNRKPQQSRIDLSGLELPRLKKRKSHLAGVLGCCGREGDYLCAHKKKKRVVWARRILKSSGMIGRTGEALVGMSSGECNSLLCHY